MLLITLGVFFQQLILIQIFYPADRMLPFASVDDVKFGGWTKTDVSKRLDKLYSNSSVSLYFGKAKQPFTSVQIKEIGLSVNNIARINNFRYPWYLRIVPTSLFWAQLITHNQPKPEYLRDSDKLGLFLNNLLQGSCVASAKDATLEYVGDELIIVPSKSGGKCDDANVVKKTLLNIKPRPGDNIVKIISTDINPEIYDEAALVFKQSLVEKVSDGVSVLVNGTTHKIPAKEIFKWMDFANKDGKLYYSLSSIKASGYLEKNISPNVTTSPGVTTITTYDFAESGRTEGKFGLGLDYVETLKNIKSSIDDGEKAKVATIKINPTIEYRRNYSNTDAGLTAMVQQYSKDNIGISGVSLIELSGKRRRASYNADAQLVAGSTYKIFLAYSALKRVESGVWSWSDQVIGGQDLSVCFDKMIVQSDNDCAEALLDKIGRNIVTKEARDIGCTQTSFITGTGYAKTSAGDLALFLAQLQSGLILNQQSNRDLLINAMKNNIHRKGIPAGVTSLVADKVGFVDEVLNDAAIVYADSGTYVLVIMTDGTNWGAIADFAKKIETFRVE